VDPAARSLYGAAALLVLSTTASLINNFPINTYLRSLDSEGAPQDWDERDPRRSWHLARTVTALLALGANAVAVATLI
jgi:hypothetical protein